MLSSVGSATVGSSGSGGGGGGGGSAVRSSGKQLHHLVNKFQTEGCDFDRGENFEIDDLT